MPITELVFPTYKPDLDAKPILAKALKHLDNVDGVLLLKLGRILQVNGVDVAVEQSSVLTLEWEQASHFQTFLASDDFKEFISMVKPLVTAPATPQLFEADGRSTACTSAALTQVFKLRVADMGSKTAVEESWRKVLKSDDGSELSTVALFDGWGLNNVEGEFLGMIGWDSVETFHKEIESSHFQSRLKGLRQYGELTIISVQYPN